MRDCFVCRKHRGELAEPGGAICDDGIVRAGHALLPPDGAPAYLGVAVSRLTRPSSRRTGAEHVYAFVLGDEVSHLHVHLVPRYPGTPRELWGARVTEWAGAPRGRVGEIEAVCALLRAHLARGA